MRESDWWCTTNLVLILNSEVHFWCRSVSESRNESHKTFYFILKNHKFSFILIFNYHFHCLHFVPLFQAIYWNSLASRIFSLGDWLVKNYSVKITFSCFKNFSTKKYFSWKFFQNHSYSIIRRIICGDTRMNPKWLKNAVKETVIVMQNQKWTILALASCDLSVKTLFGHFGVRSVLWTWN